MIYNLRRLRNYFYDAFLCLTGISFILLVSHEGTLACDFVVQLLKFYLAARVFPENANEEGQRVAVQAENKLKRTNKE